MIDVRALERMNEDTLRRWLLARVRGEQEDPPLSVTRLETPFDFVRVARDESTDDAFQARLDRVIVAALREAGQGDLRDGSDARAVRALALLADGLDRHDAAPALRAIAQRGALGGHDALAGDVESTVLIALAGLQQAPYDYWKDWRKLWREGPSRLWPVAVTGMRRADASRALDVLADVVRRIVKREGFPLGQLLWGFGRDPRIEPAELSEALGELPNAALDRCREVLREVGAKDEQIDAWVPAAAPISKRTPAWAKKEGVRLTAPPRLQEEVRP